MNSASSSRPDIEMGAKMKATLKRLATVAVRALAYVIGMTLLLVVTFVVLRISPMEGINQLWTGAVGSASSGRLYPLSATFVETAPLLLAALSVCIAWRSGLFSIGAQGQMLIGGLAAFIIARVCHVIPAPLVTLAMIVGASAGGALWGFVAGWLRVYRGVQEVISTIMLNYVALYTVSWLVLGPLRAKGNYLAETDSVPNSVMFARLIPATWSDHIQTSLHMGVILAILMAPSAYIFLFRTRSGFNLRILGSNEEAARVAKLPTSRLKLCSMGISGGIAGFAGAIQLLGSATGSLPALGFAGSTGFTAIPVALLGALHPVGILFSALFFGGLTQGCRNLEQNTGVSSVVIYVIQATAVLAVVGARAIRERSGAVAT